VRNYFVINNQQKMKKTHQIGLITALLAGVAFTPPQDRVQSSSIPASSDAAFRLSNEPGFGLSTGNLSNAYDWAFDGCLQPDNPVRDLRLTPLGVQVAYSFGL
jgi:hypothetical protein